MTREICFRLAVTGLAMACFAFAGSANAGTIFSEDFEGWDGTTDVVSGGGNGIFTATTWGNLTSFTHTADTNLLRPSGSSAWLNPVPAALGTTFAMMHSSNTATADLTDTFADNTTYTLTFTHFRRDDVAGDSVTAQIMNGASVLATDTWAAVTATDTYETRTVSWTTNGGGEVGQNIRIQLIDASGGGVTPQAGIDNIDLDATLIPEPSTFALAAIGLLGLLACGRRRRR